MQLNDYQDGVIATKRAGGLQYTGFGLFGEAGEVANEIKKLYRDDRGVMTSKRHDKIIEELGDLLWYTASLADDLGVSLEEVAQLNRDKLEKRYRTRMG